MKKKKNNKTAKKWKFCDIRGRKINYRERKNMQETPQIFFNFITRKALKYKLKKNKNQFLENYSKQFSV